MELFIFKVRKPLQGVLMLSQWRGWAFACCVLSLSLLPACQMRLGQTGDYNQTAMLEEAEACDCNAEACWRRSLRLLPQDGIKCEMAAMLDGRRFPERVPIAGVQAPQWAACGRDAGIKLDELYVRLHVCLNSNTSKSAAFESNGSEVKNSEQLLRCVTQSSAVTSTAKSTAKSTVALQRMQACLQQNKPIDLRMALGFIGCGVAQAEGLRVQMQQQVCTYDDLGRVAASAH